MTRALAILAALLLAACQTTPALPDLTTGVKTVDRPYPVPCVKAENLPAPPEPLALRVDADIEQRAAWARMRLTQLRQHDALLQAILVGCTTLGGPAP